ncbi:hypothetical protein [Corynebacterium phocae]|uniref:hypothetical protein n=1 Tax=Corynebacterium phocae TaxID=161895 RepID=UPI0012ED571F|nr:hypothetical protein [Corynebacterium phocae]
MHKFLIGSLAVAFLSASLNQPMASATPPDGAVVEEFGVIQGTASDYNSFTKETLTELDGINSSDLPFFAARSPYTIVSQWSDNKGVRSIFGSKLG